MSTGEINEILKLKEALQWAATCTGYSRCLALLRLLPLPIPMDREDKRDSGELDEGKDNIRKLGVGEPGAVGVELSKQPNADHSHDRAETLHGACQCSG